jgi:hypothetical protein
MARSTPDDSHSRLDDLQGSHAALRLVQTLHHLNNLQRIFAHHSHYNPNQPRVPQGHPDGGQWTRTGATAARGEDEIASDLPPANDWMPGAQYAARRGGRPPIGLWPGSAAGVNPRKS